MHVARMVAIPPRLTGLVAMLLMVTLVALSTGTPLAHAQNAEPAVVTDDPADLAGMQFDHIVVGAGLAGMVMATRLSEDREKRVLLIEAGNDTRTDPLVRTVRLDNTPLTVRFQSRPQLGGGRVMHTFGIGLGGSTTINGAKVDGPPASQLDALRQFGNPSWSWDETLQYMKKSQNYRAPGPIARAHGATYDVSGHGEHGPLDITFSPQSYTGFPQQTFIRALNDSMGVDKIIDAGAGEAVGYSFCPHFIKDGTNVTRETAATAYFSPIEFERANLHILTGWRGIRVNWRDESSSSPSGLSSWPTAWQRPFFRGGSSRDGDGLRAKSVTVQSRPYGPTAELSLSDSPGSQVTISTGALITPLLLELSGIGDSAVLSNIGVKAQIHLPGVGRNLVDKPTNILAASTRGAHRGGVTGDPLPAVAMLTIDKVVANVTETEQYIRENMHRWAREAVKTGGAVNVQGILRQYEVMLNGIFQRQWPVAEWEYFSRNLIAIKTFVLQPWSRGFIHSKTNNSVWNVDNEDADLHGQIWTRGPDMELQVASMRAARKLMGSEPMRGLWSEETKPGLATFKLSKETSRQASTSHGVSSTAAAPNDFDAWQDYILQTYDLICHNAGTAAMMSRDLGGVVDERFKVYGTQNLRVVDASIFPLQLSAHPSLTIFGVAEKAADVIRTDAVAAASAANTIS